MPGKKPKILFVVTEDWAFLSHRLPMAHAAQNRGWDVVVATRVSHYKKEIESEGFRVLPVGFQRGSLNPLAELGVIGSLRAIMRRERPDVVHNIALKPILDGTIAARLCGVPNVVNSFTGLGAVFIDENDRGWLRDFLIAVFRHLMRNPHVYIIVQNDDDSTFLQSHGIGDDIRMTKIRGSGVDTEAFPVHPEPEGPITVAMVARLLWDKGIGELMEAARILKDKGKDIRFVVVGTPDPENPKTVDDAILKSWQQDGLAEFPGYRSDIADVWKDAHIAVLPSYREGLPKSLLEAASCGRPMIAANVPGCRELVRPEVNGLLVSVRDSEALACAIELLANDPEERRRLGVNARRTIENDYADNIVGKKIGALYSQLAEGGETFSEVRSRSSK